MKSTIALKLSAAACAAALLAACGQPGPLYMPKPPTKPVPPAAPPSANPPAAPQH
ncbi:MAG TPA: lipoprotein [Telluria sp.]|nr:lipoprotein [Telluria sp.]